MCSRFSLLLALGASLLSPIAGAAPIIIKGSITATAPITAAMPKFRAAGIEITIDTEANTSSAVAAVGHGQADLAVATRPITAAERAAYPDRRMDEITIGFQVLAFGVPADVWYGGVRTITREQAQQIYEGDIKNWKQMGGADRPLKFFNPEAGHGVWEIFTNWVYTDSRKAPLGGQFETVAGGEETRNVIEFNAGSISLISPGRVDRHGVFALSIKTDEATVAPDLKSVLNRTYPLARPLELISGDRPTGDTKHVIDFMLSPLGREFLLKADFIPLSED